MPVYRRVLEYQAENAGEVPTLRVLKEDFPTHEFIKVDEPWPYLLERLRDQRTLALAAEGFSEGVTAYDNGDAKAVVRALTATLSQINTEVSSTRDTDLTTTGNARLELYKSYENSPGGLRGIPSGFKVIDEATLGFQPGHLITLVGEAKAGKSTLMLLVARNSWKWAERRLRVLLIGFEMSNTEVAERFDAVNAGISHTKLRSGTLSDAEKRALVRSVADMEDKESFILSADSASATTVSGIGGKITTYTPDLVLVDGVYMLDDELGEPKNTPLALTNVTRGLKRLADTRQVPIIISTQLLPHKINRKTGPDVSSIGYTSSFGQDSDAIFAVERTPDPRVQKISTLAARNAMNKVGYSQWDWETGHFEELDYNPFAEPLQAELGEDGAFAVNFGSPF